jgi:uncharacterized membrane protein
VPLWLQEQQSRLRVARDRLQAALDGSRDLDASPTVATCRRQLKITLARVQSTLDSTQPLDGAAATASRDEVKSMLDRVEAELGRLRAEQDQLRGMTERLKAERDGYADPLDTMGWRFDPGIEPADG